MSPLLDLYFSSGALVIGGQISMSLTTWLLRSFEFAKFYGGFSAELEMVLLLAGITVAEKSLRLRR